MCDDFFMTFSFFTHRFGDGLVAGWLGGFLIGNNTTSWLHLASWNLLHSQLSGESKMEPSVAITYMKLSAIKA